ncbi:MAG TPA: hypothetical protein VFA85_17170 [Terriglobales bacterium]|nr:hypothetical protein [Terriglobales bacterium]
MKFFRLLRAILREIFDEAAYERFCATEKLAIDADSYARFLEHSTPTANRKIRCC